MAKYLKLYAKSQFTDRPSDYGANLVYDGLQTPYPKYMIWEEATGPTTSRIIAYYEIGVLQAYDTKPSNYDYGALAYEDGQQVPGVTAASWTTAGDGDGPEPEGPDTDLPPTASVTLPDGQPVDDDQLDEAENAVAADAAAKIGAMAEPEFDWVGEDLLSRGMLNLYAGWKGISFAEALEVWESRLNPRDGAPMAHRAEAAAASQSDVLSALERSFWSSQHKVVDDIDTVIGPYYTDAQLSVFKKAYAGFGFALLDNGDSYDVVIGNTTERDFAFGVDFTAKALVAGSIFRDWVVLPGGGTVYFGDGDDQLMTSNTKASITAYGGAGVDFLRGSLGKDTLDGGAGADKIYGNLKQDLLTGGSSKDTFFYATVKESAVGATKRDIITDFKHGKDKIDLSQWADDGQDFYYQGRSKSFDGGDGAIIWQQVNKSGTANDYTLIRINTDLDAAAEMEIQLKGLVKLTAGDFVL